jgi:hypothetical protein
LCGVIVDCKRKSDEEAKKRAKKWIDGKSDSLLAVSGV